MIVTAALLAAAVAAAALLHPFGGPARAQVGDVTGVVTDDPMYVKLTAPGWYAAPLLTVGEDVPRLGGRTGNERFRFIGLPDGMAAYPLGGLVSVMINHEATKAAVSRPNIKPDGTSEGDFTGAFVSQYLLNRSTGRVVAGKVAYDDVYLGNTRLGAAGDPKFAFSRFCSSSIAGPPHGFDRWIYLTGEESSGADTFDGKGGQSVAVFDGHAYLLPEWGRFAKENQVVLPKTGDNTVVFVLEDGPASLDSQLYMYVGKKDPASSDPLVRNGMTNGSLYVFRSTTPGKTSEANFHMGDGVVNGEWVRLPNAASQTDTELEAATDAANAFTFLRIEDGTPDPRTPGVFYFGSTGAPTQVNNQFVNKLGRLYKITIDPANPTAGAKLEILIETDREPDARKVVNPDNMEINALGIIMIQEDATAEGSQEMTRLGRDAAIWAYNTRNGALERVTEIDQLVANEAEPFGNWETSGIFDTADLFGRWTWIFNVQAHSVNSAEASGLQGFAEDVRLIEGGQLLLLSRGRPLPLNR
jgi:hypothetical protein